MLSQSGFDWGLVSRLHHIERDTTAPFPGAFSA